jgi:hypothetical protein
METSCVGCHLQLDGPALEAAQRAPDDVHFQQGLSCHDCHGGNPSAGFDDPSVAHDESKGWRGKPRRLDVPTLCGRCHADAEFMKRFDPHLRVDQLSEYRTSVHGRRVAAGDDRAAVCIDCHGVHGIRKVGDTRSSVYRLNLAETCARCHTDARRMEPYHLTTDQYAGYKQSVHARALYDKGDPSAPTCKDCHGSHGAVPPGVTAVANVCGTCHAREATLFRETEAKRKIDLSLCIQCRICHDNHAVQPPTTEMFGVGPKSTCIACHVPGDRPFRQAAEMAAASAHLEARLGEARDRLAAAERAGVSVSGDQVALQKADDAKVELRVLAHSFDRDRYLAAAQEGTAVAEAGIEAAGRAFDELRNRRRGLAASLLFIVAVAVALALKVRELERRA